MLKPITGDEDRQKNLESGNVLQGNRKSGSGKLSTSKSKSVVAVRLLKNTRYKIKGNSGKEYVFDGAGSVLQIDAKDVDLLMEKNKNRPNSCCGDTPGSKIFELAQ